MKDWLSNNGVETDTLGKKAVTALIDEVPDELSEVLSLRQKLAKSSVRKYQAMQNAVCADNRVRGCFNFTEQTVPEDLQEDSYNFKTYHRTIWKIWQKQEVL